MFIYPVPFCLLLKFFEGEKALFQFHVGENKGVDFGFPEGSVVGTANTLSDGIPLRYRIHPSLELKSHQVERCEWLIHNGIAVAWSLIHVLRGQPTIAFPPGLSRFVTPEGVGVVSPFVYIHVQTPNEPLTIKDR